MTTPTVIWGGRGHAKVLHDFSLSTGHEIVAFFDNDLEASSPVQGIPLYHGIAGFHEWKKSNADVQAAGWVAIGGDRGHSRVEIQQFLRQNGIHVTKAIHPAACVSPSAELGTGCQVLAQSVVGPESILGDGCIVNTRASVDHECLLGHGVHVAPGATLAGCVKVGDFAFIAVGATVLPRIRIGTNSIVGAGAVVTKDVPDNSVVMGVPARVVRMRDVV